MQAIPFRELSFFSELFCDYAEDAEALKSFFNGDHRSPDDYAAHIETLRSREYHRDKLVAILARQNKELHAGAGTFANIEKLRSPDTFAVVTGQQVGLFGGPLYTIYKIVTALQLCAQLRERHRNFVFVPVFWLESEDHDYDEASSAVLIDNAGEQFTSLYPRLPQDGQHGNAGAVGAIAFDDRIAEVLDAVDQRLAATDYHAALMQMLRTAYAPGATFAGAFASYIASLFSAEGVVFINPLDRDVKRLLAPVFREELETSPRSCEAVISQSALLEDRYHAQVKSRTINLFLLWKNGRYGIDPRREHGDYWLKGTRQYFSRDELLRLLDEQPEYFSPNVVLRPICQDTILPTVAYVGGPSEIAYFAQFKPVYTLFNVPMPLIYPRASITLVEERIVAIMEKYALSLKEILDDAREAARKAARSHADVPLDEILGTSHTLVLEAFENVRAAVEAFDKTLLRTLETAKTKAVQSLDMLGAKLNDAAVRADQTISSQMRRLAANLRPADGMQERALNIAYFLNKYGAQFTHSLMRGVSLDTSAHQVITVSGKSKTLVKELQQTLF